MLLPPILIEVLADEIIRVNQTNYADIRILVQSPFILLSTGNSSILGKTNASS